MSDEERTQCGSFRSTPIVREAWQVTLDCARALKAKRILLQCPASFTPTDEHLENLHGFLSSITRDDGMELLWEPRGEWSGDLISAICREHALIHVVDPFTARTQTPEICYFRLHGRKTWRYVYEDVELEDLLTLLPTGKASYVLFNNVRMREDAMRFQELVRLRAAT